MNEFEANTDRGQDPVVSMGATERSVLDEVLHQGARRMLVTVIETEVADYIETHSDERDEEGRRLVVRNGRKQLLAVHDGYRESELSWTEVLEDLKARGLAMAPKPAVADGALDFWAALRKVYPTTRVQRCWVHKTADVLNKLPKRGY